MEAPADLGPEDRWGMILERRVFFLVSLAAAEVVGDMASAVTTADPIFLEANALALTERHGRTREGGWGGDERLWGWRRSSGPSRRPKPQPSSLSDASVLHTVIADAGSH